MPTDMKVRRVLATRHERAMADWFNRLELWADYMSPTYGDMALVRLEEVADQGTEPRVRELPQGQLDGTGVYVIRYLGDNEYLVKLWKNEDRDQLAMKGHLSVTRGGFTITAL